jgi:hypothetical protein
MFGSAAARLRYCHLRASKSSASIAVHLRVIAAAARCLRRRSRSRFHPLGAGPCGRRSLLAWRRRLPEGSGAEAIDAERVRVLAWEETVAFLPDMWGNYSNAGSVHCALDAQSPYTNEREVEHEPTVRVSRPECLFLTHSSRISVPSKPFAKNREE